MKSMSLQRTVCPLHRSPVAEHAPKPTARDASPAHPITIGAEAPYPRLLALATHSRPLRTALDVLTPNEPMPGNRLQARCSLLVIPPGGRPAPGPLVSGQPRSDDPDENTEAGILLAIEAAVCWMRAQADRERMSPPLGAP